MQTHVNLSLRERGEAQVISFADWNAVEIKNDSSILVNLGILRTKRSGESIIVEPATLVGQFNSPNFTIEVKSKRPGLVPILISASQRWRKRLTQSDPDQFGSVPADVSLAGQFRLLLLTFLEEGIPWKYARNVGATSMPRGRIKFQQTISRLSSRGINYKAIVSQQVREVDQFLVETLSTTRRAINALEIQSKIIDGDIERLLLLTGSNSDYMPQIEARWHLFRIIEEYSNRPALHDLVDFCLKVLSADEPFRISERVGQGAAEFIDMERLWEDAIAGLLTAQLDIRDVVSLHPLRTSSTTLMHDGGPKIDPDVVVYREGKPVMVADAKYSVSESAAASDVYQLAAYVQRLKVKVGLLVYVAPGEVSRAEVIGTLDNGARLILWSIAGDAFSARRGSLSC